MRLHHKLLQRAAEHKPIRIGLIGAGKFGAMYLAHNVKVVARRASSLSCRTSGSVSRRPPAPSYWMEDRPSSASFSIQSAGSWPSQMRSRAP